MVDEWCLCEIVICSWTFWFWISFENALKARLAASKSKQVSAFVGWTGLFYLHLHGSCNLSEKHLMCNNSGRICLIILYLKWMNPPLLTVVNCASLSRWSVWSYLDNMMMCGKSLLLLLEDSIVQWTREDWCKFCCEHCYQFWWLLNWYLSLH